MKIIFKQSIYTFIPAMLCMLLVASCDKYLDVKPKGAKVLESTSDYDLWLNNSDLENSLPTQLNLLSDFEDNPAISTLLNTSNEKVYTWQEQFSEDVPGTAVIWSNFYKAIYAYNAVIKGIDEAAGPSEQKRSLKAEALLGRAFEYLYLVNLYARPFNPVTAGQELAVPFVTSIDVTDPTPARSSVQDIYKHIIDDLTAAIPDLPSDNSKNRFRGSSAAAFGVLARTYLYMGDFTKAASNAQLALDNGTDTIINYASINDALGIPHIIVRPDVIYARLGGLSYLGKNIPTLDFLRTFDNKDLRLKFYYLNLGDYSFTTRGKVNFIQNGVPNGRAYVNWGLSVAEMRLIIAEAAARTNDLPLAIEQLDLLRKCRFKTMDYQKFESDVQGEVLNKVLQERTFEFPFNGTRWFDMRRLDAEGRMQNVDRLNGQGTVIASLPPNSDRYTLQIPIQILYFNPEWK